MYWITKYIDTSGTTMSTHSITNFVVILISLSFMNIVVCAASLENQYLQNSKPMYIFEYIYGLYFSFWKKNPLESAITNTWTTITIHKRNIWIPAGIIFEIWYSSFLCILHGHLHMHVRCLTLLNKCMIALYRTSLLVAGFVLLVCKFDIKHL